MRVFAIASLVVLTGTLVLGAGCAQQNTSATLAPAADDALPGVSAYYAAATEHHVRPFKKPYRDERVAALRNLESATDRLLADASTWDSDVRLVSIAEQDRSARRGAVEDFRTALRELKSAAGRDDLAGVKANYARAARSYAAVADLAAN